MGIQYTPNYHIAFMDDQTTIDQLDEVTYQVATSLDSAMGRAGYTPPDATTFAALVAKVTALETNAANAKRQRQWLFPRVGTDNQALTAGVMTSIANGTITAAPAGEYLIVTRQVISNSANAAGNMRTIVGAATAVGSALPTTGVTSLTASDPRADCIGTSRMTFTMSAGIQHAGGDLLLATGYSPTGTAGAVWNAGTMLTVAYLGPR